jgi:hypothetical protein
MQWFVEAPNLKRALTIEEPRYEDKHNHCALSPRSPDASLSSTMIARAGYSIMLAYLEIAATRYNKVGRALSSHSCILLGYLSSCNRHCGSLEGDRRTITKQLIRRFEQFDPNELCPHKSCCPVVGALITAHWYKKSLVSAHHSRTYSHCHCRVEAFPPRL